MIKKILLFITLLLNADNSLSELRLQDYRTFIQETAPLPKATQIERVNLYFNHIVNNYDINVWGVEDYWATPKEFIVHGAGDCEDFVIAKYFTLIELGFNPSDMMIYIVKVKYSRDYHVVLGVKNDHNEILILDNISWKILPIQIRTDLDILCDIKDPKLNNSTDPLIRHVLTNFKSVQSKISAGN
jgi:predicted transglutaminase-like cysteine proteinase